MQFNYLQFKNSPLFVPISLLLIYWIEMIEPTAHIVFEASLTSSNANNPQNDLLELFICPMETEIINSTKSFWPFNGKKCENENGTLLFNPVTATHTHPRIAQKLVRWWKSGPLTLRSGHHWTNFTHFYFFAYVRRRYNQRVIFEHTEKVVLPNKNWTSIHANFSDRWFTRSTGFVHEEFLLSLQYRIDCDVNFFGQNCDVYCQLKDWEIRSGRFECSPLNGLKRCKNGWSGQNCSESASSDRCKCLNGGSCDLLTGKCRCLRGFQGDHCEQCVMSVRCRGYCRKPWDCICPEGYGGNFCEKDLAYCSHHSPCQNGGTCMNNNLIGYECQCQMGFTGTNCERRVNLSNCSENPCMNGGRCIQGAVDFRCDCTEGHHGQFCQVRASPCLNNPCKNGGMCVFDQNSPTGFDCNCSAGFEGQNCEKIVNNCEVNRCRNGGVCVHKQCQCLDGYEGILCEIPSKLHSQSYNPNQFSNYSRLSLFMDIIIFISVIISITILILVFYYVRKVLQRSTSPPVKVDGTNQETISENKGVHEKNSSANKAQKLRSTEEDMYERYVTEPLPGLRSFNQACWPNSACANNLSHTPSLNQFQSDDSYYEYI